MPDQFNPKSIFFIALFFLMCFPVLALEFGGIKTDTILNVQQLDTTETDTVEAVLAMERREVKKDTALITVQLLDTAKTKINVVDAEEQEVMIYWSKNNSVGVNFNEVAFVNWNSGGNNSISALFHGNFDRKYQRELLSWKTDASVRYGVNAQEGRELRKSEDRMQLNSTFGYRRDSTSNFRYSAKLNFNTQFAHGYRYPNTDNPISKFMAPAYLFLGVGAEFTHPKEDLTVYLSPLTQKSTFVLDKNLSNEGMYGVNPAIRDEEGNIIQKGERVRTEVGILFTSGYSKEIFENINFENQLSLYTDYLNKFGNIDVDWEMDFQMVINDFIKASIGTHLRYDDDVKVKEDIDGDGSLETLGARIQFKQMLGVGLVYSF